MAVLRTAYVNVLPKTDDFDPQLKRRLGRIDARKSGERVGGTFSKGMTGSFGGIAKSLAGVFAVVGGASLFKGFIADAAESAKISRITANAIKATGGAARVSAVDVGKLAESLSNKTAIDDETIQSGANLLLTFKNIRNETGKGNDVFNQATAAVADLSIQFGSVDGASKMLGKALNDPLKGLSALSRAGVTFTAQQKDQVKTLVESGNVLGAQKIILKEIQDQVGGAAEAAAAPMDRLKVIAGNLGERIGGYLLPYVEMAAEWLGDNLPKALDAAEREGRKWLPTLKAIGSFIADDVVPALKDMAKFLKENKDIIIPLVGGIAAAVVVFKSIKLATRAWAAAQGILNAVMTANPIGLVVVAIAGLVAGFVLAYKNSETFRKIVDKAWLSIKTGAKFSWEAVLKFRDIARQAFAKVVDVFLIVVGTILRGAAEAFGWVPGIGPKLRKASGEFSKFRKDVNRELAGIKDENIAITAITRTSKTFRSVHDIVGGAEGRDRAPFAMPLMGSPARAMGGNLKVDTELPEPDAIGDIARRYKAGAQGTFVKQLAKAIRANSAPVGPNGYAFPLPRGQYRVGVPINGYPGHTGQDFPAPTGTKVYAPFSGQFNPVRLGNRSYGNYINLVAGAMRFIGAHLSGFARGAGQVRAGELLGYVGSTGNSTGPHLHAEFRRNGAVINPRQVLKYDKGGYLPPGTHVVHNGTGGPERVLNRRETLAHDGVRDGQTLVLMLDDGTQLRGYVRRQASAVVTDTTRALTSGRRV